MADRWLHFDEFKDIWLKGYEHWNKNFEDLCHGYTGLSFDDANLANYKEHPAYDTDLWPFGNHLLKNTKLSFNKTKFAKKSVSFRAANLSRSSIGLDIETPRKHLDFGDVNFADAKIDIRLQTGNCGEVHQVSFNKARFERTRLVGRFDSPNKLSLTLTPINNDGVDAELYFNSSKSVSVFAPKLRANKFFISFEGPSKGDNSINLKGLS